MFWNKKSGLLYGLLVLRRIIPKMVPFMIGLSHLILLE